jgi:hypothetical protein
MDTTAAAVSGPRECLLHHRPAHEFVEIRLRQERKNCVSLVRLVETRGDEGYSQNPKAIGSASIGINNHKEQHPQMAAMAMVARSLSAPRTNEAETLLRVEM